MKKKVCGNMRRVLVWMLVLSSILVLTACGGSKSSSSGSSRNYASDEAAAASDYSYDDVYESADYEEAGSSASGGAEMPEAQDTNRKLIKNVNITVETEEFDTCIANINTRISALGGYVEESYTYNGSNYGKSKEIKNATMTVRIPAVNLDAFLNNIAEFTNITSKNYSVTDVTLQYVDTEARRDSIKTQHQRLLDFMEQAETVEDIIALESRISDLEYELDSAERQLRSYDNQVDYSTVYLDINEVERYTPTAPKSRWQEMGEGFVESMYDAIDNLLDFFVGLVVILPHLIVLGIFVLIIVLIVRAIVKKNKKKKEEKLKAFQQQYAGSPLYQGAPAPAQPEVKPEEKKPEEAKEKDKKEETPDGK